MRSEKFKVYIIYLTLIVIVLILGMLTDVC